jgi:hypothetical protein
VTNGVFTVSAVAAIRALIMMRGRILGGSSWRMNLRRPGQRKDRAT